MELHTRPDTGKVTDEVEGRSNGLKAIKAIIKVSRAMPEIENS